MIPYLVLGGVALGALALGSKGRRKRRAYDPRTAATQRIRIVDSRHAVTRRMLKANPSPEQTRRIKQALAETRHLLAKEMKYSADLRKPAYLKFLRGHVAKLKGMLTNPPQLAGTCPKCGRPKAASAVRGEKPDRHVCYSAIYGSCLLGRRGRMRANPGTRSSVEALHAIPAGYRSAAGRRLKQELRSGTAPLNALKIALVAARQGGDHIAYEAIRWTFIQAATASLTAQKDATKQLVWLLTGTKSNPGRSSKRRKAKKAKRGKKKAKAPKHFVRTTTHTVKTVQQNPGKRKFRVFIGNSRHSEYVDVKASSEAEAFKEARRVDWLAALPQNRDRLTIFK